MRGCWKRRGHSFRKSELSRYRLDIDSRFLACCIVLYFPSGIMCIRTSFVTREILTLYLCQLAAVEE